MFLLFCSLMTAPALAQDDVPPDEEEIDPDDFEDPDGDEVEEFDRMTEGDEDIEMEEDNLDDSDWLDEGDEGDLDFDEGLEDLEEDEIGGEGVDNVAIYRQFMDDMDDLGLEEELIAWERYLEEYPNTLFRDRIDNRMDELADELYGERIDEGPGAFEDARDREIEFSHPVMLENIDPRTRARIKVELGFPSYATAGADFEYQLARPWSVHAGVMGRYTGLNIEAGTRYAVVKSARLNLLVTGIFDVRLNANPGYPALRPVVAVGKRFDVGGGLDVMAQGGVDMELFRPVFSMKYIGGVNVTYRAADVLSVFAEYSMNTKSSGTDGLSNFSFNVLSFGLKFSPGSIPGQIGLNANLPVQYNYWGYHYGSVQADFNYYLDDL